MLLNHTLLFELALIGYCGSICLLFLSFSLYPNKAPLLPRLVLTSSLALHLASLILRGLAAGHSPVANFFESMNQFIICTAMIAAIELWQRGSNGYGSLIPLLITIAALPFTYFRISPAITEMYPALQSIWFELHVIAAFISYGLFATGAGLSILYFLVRSTKYRFLHQRLPTYQTLDRKAYRHNSWGFFFFSFSMLTGGIWAHYAWGNYWIWTAKELWSAILWFYYAIYIHARFTPKWAGKRANALSILGYLVTIFTFLGVNLLLRSSHRF